MNKSIFSVAMSRETGCMVMVRTLGEKVKVVGSLDKTMSDHLASAILAWKPESKPTSNILQLPIRAYPH